MTSLFYGIGKRNGSDETSGNGLLRLVGELPVRAEGFPTNGNTHGSTPGNTYEDTPGSIPGGIHKSLSCGRETPQSLRDSSPFRRSSFVETSFRAAFLLLCLLWLFGGADVCRAQVKDITVTVYMLDQNGEKKKQQNVNVYGFYDLSRAMALKNRQNRDRLAVNPYDLGFVEDSVVWGKQKAQFRPAPGDYEEYAVTDENGRCAFPLPSDGYVLVDNGIDTVLMGVRGRTELSVRVPHTWIDSDPAPGYQAKDGME